MKLKKFITSTVVCALAVISLSGMSVSAAEAPTNEKSFTPLAPAGWNTSTTAQQIYGDAEQEPMLSSTSRAPDGWNDSAAAKLLYGDAQEELITVYSSIIVTVHSPCDQEWRELYPDTWMFEANRAIEEADALMYDKFSIDLRSEKQTAWTGNPKVVVTVNGEPIYQKEVDTVVNQSPNIKISESEVITNSINQLVVVQYGKKNGCSASQEEIDQQLNEYENSYPTIYDSALDLFGEDGLRKGIEYRIIYEKTKEYVFDLFWSEHTSVDEQSVIDFCSQKGVNYSDLSNNDRELATDAYTNFLQQDYFLEFQESLVDSAEIIY